MRLLVLPLIVLLVPAVRSACTLDRQQPGCTATCNGITLNISNVFQHPVKIFNSHYTYACRGGLPCSESESTAVCNDGVSYGESTVNVVDWVLLQTSPFKFTVTYGGGECKGVDCKQSKFTFTEVASDGKAAASFTGSDGSTFLFQVTGACVGQPNCGGGSAPDITGAIGISLIAFSVAVLIIYFVVGALIMYYVKGAQGVEVIPNVSFWKDFPYLLKDGFFFTISPCHKREMYAKI